MTSRNNWRPRLVRNLALFGVLATLGCNVERSVEVRTLRVLPSPTASENTAPNFNLEVILRAADDAAGFGHVKFRQDNDDATVVDLGVWVRDLAPNTRYRLQRAVDATVDGNCTSSAWLTLGRGTTPQDVITDEDGTGREDLFRTLSTPGNAFDIQFRVVLASSPTTVVLSSDCYQFFVR